MRAAGEGGSDVEAATTPGVIAVGSADVGAAREAGRRRRLWALAAVLGSPTTYLWWRILDGRPFDVFALPEVDPLLAVPILFFVVLILAVVGPYVFAGRSPHVTYRPEQLEVRLDDVIGIEPVKEDVVRSLNLFLAHRTFASQMGGTPRRGLLFEGAPGTGKTYLAKAMAAEAGVPFLFVSATSFQSMFYGATARKIRSGSRSTSPRGLRSSSAASSRPSTCCFLRTGSCRCRGRRARTSC